MSPRIVRLMVFTLVIAALLFSAVQSAAQSPPATPCGAESVIGYAPGLRKNGTQIEASNTAAERALGMAQNDQSLNHVALGFGGSITLGFGSNFLLNGEGNDVRIFESSGWNDTFAHNPEQAAVYASQDGIAWVLLGTSYQDGAFDLGTLAYAQFIRVVDTSIMSAFHGNPDGFDLDAVEAVYAGLPPPPPTDTPTPTPTDTPVPPTPTPTDTPVPPPCTRGIHLLPNDLYLNEGASTNMGVILFCAPPYPGEVVFISVATLDSAQLSITPNTRQLDATNWNTGRSFVITALDDAVDEGDLHDATATFFVTSTNPLSCFYNFAAPNVLTVHIYDND